MTTTTSPAAERTATVLPPLTIPVTATLVAGGALATHDYSLVHHDRAAALAAGTRDIFMNILTTTGLIGRYVTDWGGPRIRLSSVSVRLGHPVHPGDTLTFAGEIAEYDEATRRATITVSARTEGGQHASATVVAVLPEDAPNPTAPTHEGDAR
ncbi:MaoC/PaaZ C-terminal domain-containing protein [Intrasporangium sp.]|uniref:MaoC/PaaZ C-terminal domain-containing protein n=1 Tax=Intrasporangium sp. TaxID=1925024 RepID=UPI0032220107